MDDSPRVFDFVAFDGNMKAVGVVKAPDLPSAIEQFKPVGFIVDRDPIRIFVDAFILQPANENDNEPESDAPEAA